MIKKLKTFTYLLILLNVIMMLIPNNTFALSTNYNNLDYYFNSYDIKVIVNENNTLEVTETIGAYFNVNKHGIIREIPTKNTVERLDGTISKNRVNVSNIKVNEKYSVSNESGYKVLKIGDANRTFIGDKDYVISYLYGFGKDNIKEYDELYFNLIGDGWDTTIDNITFEVVMPKGFDKSKLGFSSGRKGSIDSSNVTYQVNGNVITGKVNKILNPYEALTIRLELPEGYFTLPSFNISVGQIISLVLPILFVITSYLMWRKHGKDDEVIETVEFYPPDGLNSLEVGFLYKGKAENEDVTSLLIYLANKGYIKISESESSSLFSKSQGFKITKLKEYDGDNLEEKMFFNGLFKKKPSISLFGTNKNYETDSDVNEVTSVDLYDNFYTTMNQILLNANSKENKNKIFEKNSSGKNILIILMIIAIFLVITIPPLYYYGEMGDLFLALLFPGLGFTLMSYMLLEKNQTIYVNGVPKRSKNGIKFFGFFWGSLFGGMPWAIMVLPALLQEYIYLIIYIIGLISVFILVIISKYLPKRTAFGNQMLGKIKGFKNFLETAEKDRLEMMVMENPSYFYDILPYTYVLGVSDKWINKFESISLQAPTWYDGYNSFSVTSFGVFMTSTMISANRTMSSSPHSSSSSSGGSSSTGGGSSGGGSGGGGGSSW